MSTPELFGPTVDYGTPRPSLSRSPPGSPLDLSHQLPRPPFDFVLDCERVANRARTLGAYSVARAVEWMTHLENIQLADPTPCEERAVAVAHRWCARIERAALPTPPTESES